MSCVHKLRRCLYITAFSLLATTGFCAQGAAKSPSITPNSVRTNAEYTYEVTNPFLNTTNKQLTILKQRQQGAVQDQTATVGVYGLASIKFVSSNINGVSFVPMNMRGKKSASDISLDAALLGFTGAVTPWATAYVELAYSPSLRYNNEDVKVAQAFAVFGEMDNNPIYFSIGKSKVPFGKFESLSGVQMTMPALYFGIQAQNATLGFSDNGFDVSVSAMRGGVPHGLPRTTSTGVSYRSDKAEISSFVIAASYNDTFDNGDFYVGAGWMNESSFDYRLLPELGFQKQNGAWDVNAGFTWDDFSLRAEYVATSKKWEVTNKKVSIYDMQAAYDFKAMEYDTRLSVNWASAEWQKKADVVAARGTSGQSKTDAFGATLLTNMHDNLSFFLSWQHMKGAMVTPDWTLGGMLSSDTVAPHAIGGPYSKTPRTDSFALGCRLVY